MKPKSRILRKTTPEKQRLEKNNSGEEKLRPCSIKNDKTTIIMLIESLKIYYNICCVLFPHTRFLKKKPLTEMRSHITNDDTHVFFTRYHQDLISNSPYRLPYSSCDISLENLVLDQLKIS